MYGIDISKHNGNIDLEPYKGQFVIIRVGYGHFHLDEKFERNVNECKRLGIPFGVYHYSYALNEAEAEAEAKGVLNAISKYKNDIKVGVWFDMEDADGYKKKHGFKFSNSTIAPICFKFCKIVEDAGYYAGIYTSSSWLDYVSGLNDRFDKWVANWGSNNGYQQTNTSKYGTIQQYTSKPLDKNFMYADISRYSRGNTAPTQTTQPTPVKHRFNLTVDGKVGHNTVKALQSFLNVGFNDGLLSGQLASTRKYHLAFVNGSIVYGTGGSATVKALQRWVGVVEVDGYMGAYTIKALQRKLGVKVDGYFGAETAKALQRYLNSL